MWFYGKIYYLNILPGNPDTNIYLEYVRTFIVVSAHCIDQNFPLSSRRLLIAMTLNNITSKSVAMHQMVLKWVCNHPRKSSERVSTVLALRQTITSVLY